MNCPALESKVTLYVQLNGVTNLNRVVCSFCYSISDCLGNVTARNSVCINIAGFDFWMMNSYICSYDK